MEDKLLAIGQDKEFPRNLVLPVSSNEVVSVPTVVAGVSLNTAPEYHRPPWSFGVRSKRNSLLSDGMETEESIVTFLFVTQLKIFNKTIFLFVSKGFYRLRRNFKRS